VANFKEIGRTGLKRYTMAGGIYEEFLTELRGSRGVEVYKEMSENDDVIGAILFAIEMMMRQVYFTVEPGGDSKKDEEAAEFVQQCLDDMQVTWSDTLSDILTFLQYGWSYHEIVYKVRRGNNKDRRLHSKYDDGLIGWRKLPIRSQDTLFEWRYDEEDELLGMVQMAPPTYEEIFIPLDKALLFRTKSRKDSPEGRSILRNAYRSWHFKKRMQEIEGIGVERNLAGFPVLTAPEGLEELWNPDDPDMVRLLAQAEAIVTNIKVDKKMGVVLPPGWALTMASTGGAGKSAVDTNMIIERYDSRIAATVMADFILLGHQNVGSFALADNKTNLFSVAMGAFLDIICDVFNNQAIPKLINMNADHFKGITDYPKMIHSDIEGPDLPALSTFVKDMVGVGVLTPDESIEDFLRRTANLPDKVDGGGYYPANGSQQHEHKRSEVNPKEDEEDQKEAAKAKQELKRKEKQTDNSKTTEKEQ
jgi:hypothetical protein